MRRTLYLLAAVLAGAVSTASAQAHTPVLVAHVDTAASNPYGVLVHVSGLLDSPEWLEQLNKGYTIELHWTVQLWKKGGFLPSAQAPTEWTSLVQAPPGMDRYQYTERVPGKRLDFSTLDSLKAYLSVDVGPPAPRNRLAAGGWYYVVTVDIAALTQEQLDDQANGTSGGLLGVLRGFVNGSGLKLPLQKRVELPVRK
jgi:hypothetical protein